MKRFNNWIAEKHPDYNEGIGILRIIKQMMPASIAFSVGSGGCSSCNSGVKTIKGSGPDKESALRNALEEIDGEPKNVELIDQDNDIYTFKVTL